MVCCAAVKFQVQVYERVFAVRELYRYELVDRIAVDNSDLAMECFELGQKQHKNHKYCECDK